MPDREKVIKGLEAVSNSLYFEEVVKPDDFTMLLAAIDLLKEQDTVEHALEVLKAHGWKDGDEAVKPIIERSRTGLWPLCGVCEGALTTQGKYCPHCGSKVMWDA